MIRRISVEEANQIITDLEFFGFDEDTIEWALSNYEIED